MPPAADLTTTARVAPSRVRIVGADGRRDLVTIDARGQIILWASLLLAAEAGLAELAPGDRDAAGTLRVRRARDSGLYPRAAEPVELADRALALAGRGREVFCGPLAHAVALPGAAGVSGGRVLWVDLDDERAISRLITFDPVPCLIVASGGDGHAHGFWRLSRRLPARALEDANARLARALEGDPAVKDRGRLMRLPGTFNGKHGRACRVLRADLRPLRHDPEALLGPVPAAPERPVVSTPPRRINGALDPLRDVDPETYFRALCGVEAAPGRAIRCPLPDHEDLTPSCRVYPDGWWCFGCSRGGRMYDLASLLLGGPWGRQLRGEPFRRARALAHERLGIRPRR